MKIVKSREIDGTIRSHLPTPEYRTGWDRTFKKDGWLKRHEVLVHTLAAIIGAATLIAAYFLR